MLALRHKFAKVVMVYPGEAAATDDTMPVRPWPNPTALLGALGLTRLKRRIDQRVLFPSNRILFYLAARRRLARTVRKDLDAGRNVCVLLAVPPHGVLPLIPYLRRHVPEARLVVDWQDLWSHDRTYLDRYPEDQQAKLRRLEQDAIAAADLNITTNSFAEQQFQKLFAVPKDGVTHIVHHFDREDAPGNTAREGKLKIGFLGTLFKPPKVPGARVLSALDDAIDAGIDVELHVFGGAQERAEEALATLRHDFVRMHPHAPLREALRNLATCDYVLLTLADEPNCRIIMHGKLPHYLLTERPIIALVPDDSYVAHMIAETGTGTVIGTDRDWGEALVNLLTQYRRDDHRHEPNQAAVKEFDFERLQHRWLNALVGRTDP